VVTTVTPSSQISARNSRLMIIASALLLTTISSNARQRSLRAMPRRRRDRVASSRLRASRRRSWTSIMKAWKCARAFLDRQRLVEQVHQHRLAAPDPPHR
jgi:hypothetical protein